MSYPWRAAKVNWMGDRVFITIIKGRVNTWKFEVLRVTSDVQIPAIEAQLAPLEQDPKPKTVRGFKGLYDSLFRRKK